MPPFPPLQRAEIAALLAEHPIDLPLVDEHGVTRDGERFAFGPAGHGVLGARPPECELLHADLIRVVHRPGANLVVQCRVPERADAIATSHRFAGSFHVRLISRA